MLWLGMVFSFICFLYPTLGIVTLMLFLLCMMRREIDNKEGIFGGGIEIYHRHITPIRVCGKRKCCQKRNGHHHDVEDRCWDSDVPCYSGCLRRRVKRRVATTAHSQTDANDVPAAAPTQPSESSVVAGECDDCNVKKEEGAVAAAAVQDDKLDHIDIGQLEHFVHECQVNGEIAKELLDLLSENPNAAQNVDAAPVTSTPATDDSMCRRINSRRLRRSKRVHEQDKNRDAGFVDTVQPGLDE